MLMICVHDAFKNRIYFKKEQTVQSCSIILFELI